MTQNPNLLELLYDEIRNQGPLTFARYMELALYHPEFGYYRQRNPFGRAGDFYTAEQLQPVFGELVATFVEQLTERSGAASPFPVLELGSGRGEMAEALHPFGYRPYDWNSSPLPQHWTGLVLANEFFDALPIHLLEKRSDGWVELLIERRDDRLGFTSGRTTQALREYTERYGETIPIGGRLEACLEADEWMDRMAGILSSGYLIVFDYGYDSRELVRFPEGTLASYRNHQMYADVLSTPGRQDITAHVNFTWLRECADRSGFSCRGSLSLAAWALRVWGEEELERRWRRGSPGWRMQWKQLVFGMGETFHVIEFERSGA